MTSLFEHLYRHVRSRAFGKRYKSPVRYYMSDRHVFLSTTSMVQAVCPADTEFGNQLVVELAVMKDREITEVKRANLWAHEKKDLLISDEIEFAAPIAQNTVIRSHVYTLSDCGRRKPVPLDVLLLTKKDGA